eukprot:TRINITY_DN59492_c0_g1_i1.p1 TRINITY_DN59492_c0_g1~~TRINITY_DN59492_c0_g1_i1.p1  ORF type:complete len:277 (+),score=24.51 TRINITY_DN59492_c0_g1_i1:51-833(+)
MEDDDDVDDPADFLYFGDYEDHSLQPWSSAARSSTEDAAVCQGNDPLEPKYVETDLLATPTLREWQAKVTAKNVDVIDSASRKARLRPGKRRRDRIKALLTDLNGCASTELLYANRRTVVYYNKVNLGMPWKVKARGISLDTPGFSADAGRIPDSCRVECMVLPWDDCHAGSSSDCLAVASGDCLAGSSASCPVPAFITDNANASSSYTSPGTSVPAFQETRREDIHFDGNAHAPPWHAPASASKDEGDCGDPDWRVVSL